MTTVASMHRCRRRTCTFAAKQRTRSSREEIAFRGACDPTFRLSSFVHPAVSSAPIEHRSGREGAKKLDGKPRSRSIRSSFFFSSLAATEKPAIFERDSVASIRLRQIISPITRYSLIALSRPPIVQFYFSNRSFIESLYNRAYIYIALLFVSSENRHNF